MKDNKTTLLLDYDIVGIEIEGITITYDAQNGDVYINKEDENSPMCEGDVKKLIAFCKMLETKY
jgi:hypothetical protein